MLASVLVAPLSGTEFIATLATCFAGVGYIIRAFRAAPQTPAEAKADTLAESVNNIQASVTGLTGHVMRLSLATPPPVQTVTTTTAGTPSKPETVTTITAPAKPATTTTAPTAVPPVAQPQPAQPKAA